MCYASRPAAVTLVRAAMSVYARIARAASAPDVRDPAGHVCPTTKDPRNRREALWRLGSRARDTAPATRASKPYSHGHRRCTASTARLCGAWTHLGGLYVRNRLTVRQSCRVGAVRPPPERCLSCSRLEALTHPGVEDVEPSAGELPTRECAW